MTQKNLKPIYIYRSACIIVVILKRNNTYLLKILNILSNLFVKKKSIENVSQ